MYVSNEVRRLRADEMDRVDTRMIRPYVQSGQTLCWLQVPGGLAWFELVWRNHSSGTFTPGSAAYANRLRKSVALLTPIKEEHLPTVGQRGKSCGLIMFFACPICDSPCRVLYSKKGERRFGCVKCNRPAYPSNCLPYTGRRNASPASLAARQMLRHRQAGVKHLRSSRAHACKSRKESAARLALMHLQLSLMYSFRSALLCGN